MPNGICSMHCTGEEDLTLSSSQALSHLGRCCMSSVVNCHLSQTHPSNFLNNFTLILIHILLDQHMKMKVRRRRKDNFPVTFAAVTIRSV